jgi:hypothetical protein
MPSCSQAQLIVGAKTLANAQVGGAWSTTEWQDASNRAYEAMWTDVLNTNDTWRVTLVNFTLATNVNSVSLTSIAPDFQNAICVAKDPLTTSRQFIRRNPEETPDGRTFRLGGTLLYIDPLESAPGNYQLQYNPTVTPLAPSSPGPQVDMDVELAQHREWVELKMALAYLASEEAPAGDILTRWNTAHVRLLNWAARQRSSEPQLVRDVRPRWRNPRLYPF